MLLGALRKLSASKVSSKKVEGSLQGIPGVEDATHTVSGMQCQAKSAHCSTQYRHLKSLPCTVILLARSKPVPDGLELLSLCMVWVCEGGSFGKCSDVLDGDCGRAIFCHRRARLQNLRNTRRWNKTVGTVGESTWKVAQRCQFILQRRAKRKVSFCCPPPPP